MLRKEINSCLKIAKEAALTAGKFLIKYARSSRRVRRDFGKDIKIKADTEAEGIILDRLKKESDFSILSEERGFSKRNNQSFIWIVDPLDGSFNYARGIPLCCVSIGLWQEGNPILGVVYEFSRYELFSGVVGKGAWLNKCRLKVSNTSKKKKAVLCTGFPVKTDFTPQGIKAFVNHVRSYKKIRLLGSAALSLTYVASSKADAYQERDIMFWDIAGGIPILLGAGGKLRIDKATNKYSFHIFASNGKFH